MTNKDAESGRQDGGSKDSGKPKIKSTFTCPMCSKEHNAAEDLIPLSPDEEEIAVLLEKALARQQSKKATKKQKESKVDPAPSTDQAAPVQQNRSCESPSMGEPSSAANLARPATSTSEHAADRVPVKRIRDWVLESEPAIPTAASSKHSKITA